MLLVQIYKRFLILVTFPQIFRNFRYYESSNMKTLIIALIAILINPAFAQKDFTVSGFMQHTDLEGGCWFLLAKNTKYELTASPEILATCHVEGRMLTLRAHLAPMMKSICMIGTMIEVTEVLDTLFHPHNPPFERKKIKGIIRKTKAGCWYVASGKRRYELQQPIPAKFMHSGARYNRLSVLLPDTESQCNMNGVITISELEPDMKSKEAKERKSDPR